MDSGLGPRGRRLGLTGDLRMVINLRMAIKACALDSLSCHVSRLDALVQGLLSTEPGLCQHVRCGRKTLFERHQAQDQRCCGCHELAAAYEEVSSRSRKWHLPWEFVAGAAT